MATEIQAPLHFRALLSSNTYVITDFYATWCPPCKMIAPIYNQLASAHSAPGQFAFAKVNVDEQREISSQYRVTAMPTFLLFKNGQKVDEIRGADPRRIKAAVEKASTDIKSEAVKAAQAVQPEPTKEEKPSTETTTEIKTDTNTETKTEEEAAKDEKKASGSSYGMVGGSNWKMSLH